MSSKRVKLSSNKNDPESSPGEEDEDSSSSSESESMKNIKSNKKNESKNIKRLHVPVRGSDSDSDNESSEDNYDDDNEDSYDSQDSDDRDDSDKDDKNEKKEKKSTTIKTLKKQSATPSSLKKKNNNKKKLLPFSSSYNNPFSMKGIKFSKGQERVIELVSKGKNVFFTGEAGTGKSLLLNYLVHFVLPKNKTRVTASTGVAAVLIGGTTLHNFIGAGLAEGKIEDIEKSIRKKPPILKQWQETKSLIIDEVSMCSGDLIDKVYLLSRKLRPLPSSSHTAMSLLKKSSSVSSSSTSSPTGGLQIIISGDPLQLPPPSSSIDKRKKPLFFQAENWNHLIQESVVLDVIFRQSDPKLQKALSEVRINELSQETIELFQSCVGRVLTNPRGIEPTILYPTKDDVSHLNDTKLRNLKGKEYIFISQDIQGRGCSKGEFEQFQKNCLAPEILTLKVGAQVMLVKNINTSLGLVNGSRGVIIKFEKQTEDDTIEYPVVLFLNGQEVLMYSMMFERNVCGKVVASRKQVPLMLAWALTIHKSQSLTIDYLIVYLERCFEEGQVYTALSRVRNLEGLSLTYFPIEKIKCNLIAKNYCNSLIMKRDSGTANTISTDVTTKIQKEEKERKIYSDNSRNNNIEEFCWDSD